MAVRILLQNARISFPNVFAPKINVNDSGVSSARFGAALIIPKNHPQIPDIQKALKDVAIDKWGEVKGAELYKSLSAGDKICLHNGDGKTQYQGFEGNLFVSANSPTKPMVVDSDKRTPLSPQDGRPYAGCYVNASIEIWAQDNKNGKRLNAKLLAVMFVKHAEPFAGGGFASEEEFDSLPEAKEEEANEFL